MRARIILKRSYDNLIDVKNDKIVRKTQKECEIRMGNGVNIAYTWFLEAIAIDISTILCVYA